MSRQADKEEHKTFLQARVNPILSKMVVDILVRKPDNVVAFMRKWLDEKGDAAEAAAREREEGKSPKRKKQGAAESDQEDDEDAEEMIPLEVLIAKKKGNLARFSVSAEAYGAFNQRKSFVPKEVPKTEEQKARIKARISTSFMFSALDPRELNIVILAMEERTFNAGETVIKQGDDGDVLYVVDSGVLDCFRRPRKDADQVFLKKYHPGDAFGELALLYNAPRAATIIAAEPCVLFALDRETFNNIVKDAAARRREQYESFLQKVELLDTMDPYERAQLSDAFKTISFKAGDFVVREGERGDVFFFIEEGQAIATKVMKSGKEETVYNYKPGDYFGELALLRDTPRAANIIAQTDMKLVTLDRASFKRLLGPLEDILRRNFTRYEKYTVLSE
eukprot:TRINITY_DN7375_c0_g3_i1.p1 TRINITY_DN7375_c0_g3~~TRINITY_DN7375_c0_g3_i1.p1  ORF type:complete len:393 (-),score=123.23 TRINITY_DN7375_c0_g3_i1:146-1324(-)